MKPDKHERFARLKEQAREQFYRSISQLGASKLSQCLKEAKTQEKGK
ncbi:MAG: hypothetical protein KIB40_02480 [Pantoea sp.]|jgi:hypothetical protein|uniref:Uncharacterized protein n=1 Tax=[Curtobacterium] plantarum TaxID=221276 RepID=A0ABT9T6F1_9GAMM|nr:MULTISPECIES: hypothetical protein [Pantoea]MBS6032011.1 hypothetical protein [Pantoea sp.]MDQ0019035.1 hypothetical protein [[Curtobacterium] plantarum]NEG58000.1 hypothetical protein [Pantoea agglomerans]NEG99714.1 hypothetical protein [Pantoea agglomerans]NEH04324.1 hypothetical protein [Pantoea agglomerans]